jgi:hypothetical protein
VGLSGIEASAPATAFQPFNVVCPICQHEGRSALPNADNISDDLAVSLFVGNECGVRVVNCEIRDFGWDSETGGPRQYKVPKGRALGGFTGAEIEPYWSALHENDRVVSVFSARRRGRANNEFRFDLPHDLLETEGGQVVTLVHDYVSGHP